MTLTYKSSGGLWLSLMLALSLSIGTAEAATAAGTVKNLSGYLLAKKGDGSVKILAQQSSVEVGDTLTSEGDSYALIRFTDESEITLGPKTQLKIDAFAFDAARPESDRAALELARGSVGVFTGEIGKRNPEKFSLATPVGTIGGGRNAIFTVEYVVPESVVPTTLTTYMRTSLAMGSSTMNDGPVDAAFREAVAALAAARTQGTEAPWQLAQNTPLGVAPKPPALPPGLYVSVIDGAINLTNKGGSTNFSAGQFGYTANVTKPPVVVPANPGIKFTPPPTFSQSTPGNSNSGSKPAAIDCEVR